MSYNVVAKPNIVSNKNKQREETIPIHLDKRVFKGITHHAIYLKKVKNKETKNISDKVNMNELVEEKPKNIYEMRPKPPEKGKIDLETYLIDPEDKVVVKKNSENFQTDEFKEYEPDKKFKKKVQSSGVHMYVQTIDEELFNQDIEVMPILEVLADKTINQSILELEEEHEIDEIEKYKRSIRDLKKKRNEEVTEMERNEIEKYSRTREKVQKNYFPQECQKQLEYKIHSLHNAKAIVKSLNNHVLNGLIDKGYSQSWSNISTITNTKNFIMENSENKKNEKDLFTQYINNLVDKIYTNNCFADERNINKQKSSTSIGRPESKLQKYQFTFNYPFDKNITLSTQIKTFIDMKGSLDEEKSAIAQLKEKIDQNSGKEAEKYVIDENDISNVEDIEQNIVPQMSNVWKNKLPINANTNFKLLDLKKKIYIQISYDSEIIITSSQSMIEFYFYGYNEDGQTINNLADINEDQIKLNNEYNSRKSQIEKTIINEEYEIDIVNCFKETKYKFKHLILFAKLKQGYKDFFNNVNCKIMDENHNLIYNQPIVNIFNLEEPNNNQFILFHIQKCINEMKSHKITDLYIKKEDVFKEFDSSQESGELTDLRTETNKKFNIKLYNVSQLISQKEVDMMSDILNLMTLKPSHNPLIMKFNSFTFKNEVENKKNRGKMNKNVKLSLSELQTKCYDQFEISQIISFVLTDFRVPHVNESIKDQSYVMNLFLLNKLKSQKKYIANGYFDTVAFFLGDKIIPTTADLLDAIKLKKEIEIKLISKDDMIRLQPREKTEENVDAESENN